MVLAQETAALQVLIEQFPTPINREIVSKIREFSSDNRELIRKIPPLDLAPQERLLNIGQREPGTHRPGSCEPNFGFRTSKDNVEECGGALWARMPSGSEE
jgi:hypothetical protein